MARSEISHFASRSIPSSFRTSHCVRYLLVGMSCSRSAEGLRTAKIHDRSCSQLNVSQSAQKVHEGEQRRNKFTHQLVRVTHSGVIVQKGSTEIHSS